MPAVVMDHDEASVQEEIYQTGPQGPKRPNLSLSRVTSATDPHRPESPYSDTSESRFRLQKASASHYSQAAPYATASPVLKHRWSAATSSPLETLAERPEKRLRLDSRQEPGQTETFRRSGIPPVSSHDLFDRASALLTEVSWQASQHESFPQISQSLSTRSPRPPDFMDHDIRSQCSNCWGTEELISSLIGSLYDLQLELSKASPTRTSQKPFEVSAFVRHRIRL